MRYLKSLWQNRSGASALEFALVAPVLFLVMFGIVDLGRYLFTQQSLDMLASANARAVMVNCANANNGQLKGTCNVGLTATQAQQAAPFIAGQSQVNIGCAGTCPATGQITVKAYMTTPFTFALPWEMVVGPGTVAALRAALMTQGQTATLYY